MEKLRYGIIGTGGISPKHLDGYSALGSDVEIVSACDINEGRLNKAADNYGISRRYTDYKQMLREEKLDFVSVCVPNYLHMEVAVAALEAGLHVHCEKPMAMNARQAWKMVEAQKQSGKRLMVGVNNRFTAMNQYVKSLIKEGALGDIYFAKTGWVRRNGLPHAGWFCEKEYAGGGALMDLGVHFIDLILYFLDFPAVRNVAAKTYSLLGRPETYRLYAQPRAEADAGLTFNVEELAAGFLDLEGNAGVSFEISWASNIEEERNFYEIYGTDGGVRYSHRTGGGMPELSIYSRMGGQLVDITPRINPKPFENLEFREFVDCVRSGADSAISPPEHGARMMEVIDAIYRAAESTAP